MFAKPKHYEHGTWYWHSISRKTIVQSIVLAVVLGPLIALLHGEFTITGIAFSMFCMGFAPFIVDGLKPTIIRK